MKTISIKDVTQVPAKDIKPGHVLIEGVVVEARVQHTHKGAIQCYFYDMAAQGTTVFAEPLQVVQVIGQVSPEMVEAIKEKMAS